MYSLLLALWIDYLWHGLVAQPYAVARNLNTYFERRNGNYQIFLFKELLFKLEHYLFLLMIIDANHIVRHQLISTACVRLLRLLLLMMLNGHMQMSLIGLLLLN